MGKIAKAVIAKLTNDVFTSFAALNAGIRKAVKEFNDKPFPKRPGSRRNIFETEEKPYLSLCRSSPMKSVNGLTGIKSAATPIYDGTKSSIPFYTSISDARWMSNLTAILHLSIIAGQR